MLRSHRRSSTAPRPTSCRKISHELRSPLTSVIGYVEMLIDAGEDAGAKSRSAEQQARMLAIIDRNSRRLLALIEDLLTMSRVEAGTLELDVGPVDIAEVVQSVRETITPDVANAGLHLSVDLDPDSRRSRRRHGRPRPARAGAAQPRVERGEVHRARWPGRDRHTRARRRRWRSRSATPGPACRSSNSENLFTKFSRGAYSQRAADPGNRPRALHREADHRAARRVDGGGLGTGRREHVHDAAAAGGFPGW